MAEQTHPQFTAIHYFRSGLTALTFITALFITMIVVIPIYILTLGQSVNWIIKHFGYFIGKSCMIAAGVKMKVNNEHFKGKHPAVYLINHTSTLDVLILLCLQLPNIRFVAKKEFQYNPLIFILGNLTGQVFIDRSNTTGARNKLLKAIRRIKRQKLSVLFAPEGTRQKEGKIGEFKMGAFHMALDLKYPIIPIYIENARELCPGSSILTKSGTVEVTFKEGIDTQSWSRDNITEHAEDVRNLYINWNANPIAVH